MPSLVAWVIHLDMKEPVATFLEQVRGKTTYWSIKKERNKIKTCYIVTSSRRHEHQGPGTASCRSLHPRDLLISLLSLSIISLFLLILISLSLLSWSLWSSSCSNSRCSLSRILLFIWTVALATPCTSARGLLSVDSKDSAFQGLMETEDSENKVEDWEFVRKTSSEGEPSVDESIAMLFDPAILRSETK